VALAEEEFDQLVSIKLKGRKGERIENIEVIVICVEPIQEYVVKNFLCPEILRLALPLTGLSPLKRKPCTCCTRVGAVSIRCLAQCWSASCSTQLPLLWVSLKCAELGTSLFEIALHT